jgi:catalase
MKATPAESTRAANEAFGRHPGYRALHARGTLLKGTFTSTPEAAELTRAGHMQGDSVPVTVRVSNGGGDPDIPDYVPDVRGFAIKFYLPDGSRTDIVAQSAPRFPVHTPEAFLELLHAQKRSPAMAWKLPLFLARHPEAIVRLPPNVPALRPPQSYATCRYYAIHAFRFLDSGGGSHYVRYTFLPAAGDHRLGPREAKRRGPEYLQQEIGERVAREPIRFDLMLQIAQPGDNVDDPASSWPSSRKRVSAGTVELTALETERETGGDVLVFDPSRVSDGIECSEDPVLKFRPPAYSDSVAQRTEA